MFLKKSAIALILVASMSSCKKEKTLVEAGTLNIEFDNVVGNDDFQLQKTFIVDGKKFSFTDFRYWISNLRLQKEDGTWYQVANSYYLIEETGDIAVQDGNYQYGARKREIVSLQNIPNGKYKTLEFAVGVDAVKNDNLSITSGELSTMNGMTNISWMWHTSYIFSSLNGLAEDNTTKVIKIETGLNESYRTITVNLKSPIEIAIGSQSQIHLKGDIKTLLQSFDSWVAPSVGAQQPNLMKNISDNFQSKFFTLK
ncbi:hypothetical protein SAMN03003324_00593 [Pedobacter antarcticus]|nr:MbnP family protein [Pedobacter antarcticus]SFE47161.1 hypothetical protein SAMN03003324_00593 [Pedobacter antarcticus]